MGSVDADEDTSVEGGEADIGKLGAGLFAELQPGFVLMELPARIVEVLVKQNHCARLKARADILKDGDG